MLWWRRGLRWMTLSLLTAQPIVAGCQAKQPSLVGLQPDFPALARAAGEEEPALARAQKPEPRKTSPLELGPEASGSRDGRGARIRAVVNGEAILDEEVLAAAYQYLVSAQTEAEKAEILNARLNEIIDREVVLQDAFARLARAKNTSVIQMLQRDAGKEFERQWLHRMMMHNKETDEEKFKRFLRATGMPLDMIRRQWERNYIAMEILRNRIFPILQKIGHPQVAEYYDRHPEEFRVEDSVVWQDIFIATARHPSRDAARRFADVLVARIRRGEDFVRLAREFDNGDSSLRDNAEGIGRKRGEINPPEAEPILLSLKKGEVGPPVEIETGFHIVRLLERTHAGRRPFDDKVQKEIGDKLKQEAFVQEMKRVVRDLRRGAIIEVAN